MSEIVLPDQKIKASIKSPKFLIIFSKPKTGKTSLAAELPDSLLLDLEDGSDFVDAIKIKANSIAEIKKIGEAIKEKGKPYKYIVVDSGTALEDHCLSYAEILYARTPMGKYWFKYDEKGELTADSGKKQYGNITALPNGAGYQFTRQAFDNIITYIMTLAPRVILSCHVKDIMLDKNGVEFSSMEIDLTGN